MVQQCPDCNDAHGEIVDQRPESPSGVTMRFECPDCGHRWNVTL